MKRPARQFLWIPLSLIAIAAFSRIASAQPVPPPDLAGDCLACDDALDECMRTCECEDPPAGTPGHGLDCPTAMMHCVVSCRTDYGDCWQEAGCDDLDLDCQECLGCAAGCEVTDPECVDQCDGFQDACWMVKDCGGPYVETTPVCYYLERGIDDFVKDLTDVYVVTMPGVTTLADLEKIELGLDLPATHCEANPHGIPCADRDYRTRWLIDSLGLQIGDVTFFRDTKGPGQAFLLAVFGGSGDEGITGYDRTALRANPSWGLSEKELMRFYGMLPLPDDLATPPTPDDFLAIAGQPKFDKPVLERLLEGAFGRVFARDSKAGDPELGCAGKMYCDNGPLVFGWRHNYTGHSLPDCDLPPCLAGPRTTTPWLELGRVDRPGDNQDYLVIDVDLELAIADEDPLDCPGGTAPCSTPNGTTYDWQADLGLTLVLEPACVESPGQPDKHAIGFLPREISVRVEDGSPAVDLLTGALDAVCWIFSSVLKKYDAPAYCEEGLLEGAVQDILRDAFAKVTVLEGLDECPAPVAHISEQLELTLNLDVPEWPDVERVIASNQFVRWARLRHTPGGPAQPALETHYGVHVADLAIDQPLAGKVIDDIAGPPAPTQKVPFWQLSELAAPLCAMLYELPVAEDETIRICAAELDLAAIALPPPTGIGADAFDCDAAIAPGDPVNDARCEDLARIKAFLMQDEVYTHCVLPHTLGFPIDTPTLADMWLAFSQAVAGCAAASPFDMEQLIPVPAAALAITTGREGASETFPFVRFVDEATLPPGKYQDFKCKNRLEWEVVPDPPDYADCADVDDPSLFGHLGCRCADIDVLDFDEILADGGYPDGAGSFLEHGLDGPGQYCRDDSGDGVNEVVCGRVTASGKHFPMCMLCGSDTILGCACQTDADCEGFEDGLSCVGSTASEGWAGGVGGRCLPDRGTASGREALEELRWFCLDNCDAIDGHAGAVGGCYFNQKEIQVDHGTCVSTVDQCDGVPRAVCESEGLRCSDGGAGPDTCDVECLVHADCQALGFPPDWVCDSAVSDTPHCVPPECADGDTWSFCALYR